MHKNVRMWLRLQWGLSFIIITTPKENMEIFETPTFFYWIQTLFKCAIWLRRLGKTYWTIHYTHPNLSLPFPWNCQRFRASTFLSKYVFPRDSSSLEKEFLSQVEVQRKLAHTSYLTTPFIAYHKYVKLLSWCITLLSTSMSPCRYCGATKSLYISFLEPSYFDTKYAIILFPTQNFKSLFSFLDFLYGFYVFCTCCILSGGCFEQCSASTLTWLLPKFQNKPCELWSRL